MTCCAWGSKNINIYCICTKERYTLKKIGYMVNVPTTNILITMTMFPNTTSSCVISSSLYFLNKLWCWDCYNSQSLPLKPFLVPLIPISFPIYRTSALDVNQLS